MLEAKKGQYFILHERLKVPTLDSKEGRGFPILTPVKLALGPPTGIVKEIPTQEVPGPLCTLTICARTNGVGRT